MGKIDGPPCVGRIEYSNIVKPSDTVTFGRYVPWQPRRVGGGGYDGCFQREGNVSIITYPDIEILSTSDRSVYSVSTEIMCANLGPEGG